MSPTTKLEAVNQMLACIDQSPVTTLSGTTSIDVQRAITTLDDISRRVQSRGWMFNTTYNETLTYSGGVVAVPSDVARLEFNQSQRNGRSLVIRDNKVYDQNDGGTFDVGGNITCDVVVRYLDFESLPASAREYILIRAARVFTGRTLVDQALYVYTKEEEEDARRLLERDQALTQDANMLRAPGVDLIVDRTPRFDGSIRWVE